MNLSPGQRYLQKLQQMQLSREPLKPVERENNSDQAYCSKHGLRIEWSSRSGLPVGVNKVEKSGNYVARLPPRYNNHPNKHKHIGTFSSPLKAGYAYTRAKHEFELSRP